MESQPQNPETRNNPENFHPCGINLNTVKHLYLLAILTLALLAVKTKIAKL